MDNEVFFDQGDIEKNKTNGLLMTIIPILFFLPLVSDDMKNSSYLKFFSNQTLLVIIASALAGICGKILGLIPFIGGILGFAVSILVLVLYIINIVNAANGKGKKLPVIGGISLIK